MKDLQLYEKDTLVHVFSFELSTFLENIFYTKPVNEFWRIVRYTEVHSGPIKTSKMDFFVKKN